MLIIGAKGFAKEVLEILHQKENTNNLCFYDDISPNIPDTLYNKFKVLKSEDEVAHYFNNIDSRFTIGIGNPKLRYLLYQKFKNIGGGKLQVQLVNMQKLVILA